MKDLDKLQILAILLHLPYSAFFNRYILIFQFHHKGRRLFCIFMSNIPQYKIFSIEFLQKKTIWFRLLQIKRDVYCFFWLVRSIQYFQKILIWRKRFQEIFCSSKKNSHKCPIFFEKWSEIICDNSFQASVQVNWINSSSLSTPPPPSSFPLFINKRETMFSVFVR